MYIVLLRDQFQSRKYDELLNPEYVKLPTFQQTPEENISNLRALFSVTKN